jgi:hypothetical protein
MGKPIYWLFPALAVAFPGTVQAHSFCTSFDEVAKTLTEMHDEKPVERVALDAGHVLEVYRSERGGWTLVVTTPDGRSCVPAAFGVPKPPEKGT